MRSLLKLYSNNLVGMAGFEPTTSSTPCWRDTRLRYIPFLNILQQLMLINLHNACFAFGN